MLAPRKTLYSTPLSAFCQALELVKISTLDVVYDLGCGDGRLLIEAARRFGVRAIGVEINPKRAQDARDAAEASGMSHLVTVHQGNALEFDIPTDATIVFLFLISRGLSYVKHTTIVKLMRPKLEQLQTCRVITYLYRIPDLLPFEKHLVSVKKSALEQGDDKSALDPTELTFPVYIYHFSTS